LPKRFEKKHDYDLASQLWRSGTSIGANVEEAQAAQSRADFKSKMSIAAKEARETHYWLRLARDSATLNRDVINHVPQDAEAIRRILISIVKSTSN
jgi:four helix bundle protein